MYIPNSHCCGGCSTNLEGRRERKFSLHSPYQSYNVGS